MKKTVNIIVNEPDLILTEERMIEKQEYNNVMSYLINHLHSSNVISQIIIELIRWQNAIIKDMAIQLEK